MEILGNQKVGRHKKTACNALFLKETYEGVDLMPKPSLPNLFVAVAAGHEISQHLRCLANGVCWTPGWDKKVVELDAHRLVCDQRLVDARLVWPAYTPLSNMYIFYTSRLILQVRFLFS